MLIIEKKTTLSGSGITKTYSVENSNNTNQKSLLVIYLLCRLNINQPSLILVHSTHRTWPFKKRQHIATHVASNLHTHSLAKY